jgi:hypothetical protein
MKQLRRIYNFPRSEKGFHRLKRLFEMLSISAFWLDSQITTLCVKNQTQIFIKAPLRGAFIKIWVWAI